MPATIGSLGLTQDLDVMLRKACYEPGVQGHEWEGRGQVWPASPDCPACLRTMRNGMKERGVSDDTIRRYFDKIGAKWIWKAAKPRTPEGLESIELNGGTYLQYRKKKDERAARLAIRREQAKLREGWAIRQRALGWHIRYVEKLTGEMRKSNRSAETRWDRTVQAREAMIEQGATAKEAQEAHGWTWDPYYVESGKG